MSPSRLPRPATVLAFAALVISLTGSAIAAKKYLITSTKQIKPSVLAQLKGNTGPAGAKGDTGAAGAKGDTGATGATGAKGDTGTAGTNGTDGTNGTNGTSGGTTTKQAVVGEVTTTSTSNVDLGGPSITLNIPTGGATVVASTSFDAKNSGGSSSSASIHADGASIGCGGTTTSASYVRRAGGCAVALDAGSHTIDLRYGVGANTGSFQNRTLYVTVLG